jgi:hypothetical protein
MTNKRDEEIAALKARVEELERAAKPPEPFKPEPYQRYDPTEGMRMPPSALAAMVAAVPDHVIREIAMRDGRAPTGRPGMIPNSQQSSGGGGSGSANVPGSGTGWAHETPIGPPPGLRYVDAQLDAQDARDRAELIEREARLQATEKAAEQSEKLQKLIEENKKLAEKIR